MSRGQLPAEVRRHVRHADFAIRYKTLSDNRVLGLLRVKYKMSKLLKIYFLLLIGLLRRIFSDVIF